MYLSNISTHFNRRRALKVFGALGVSATISYLARSSMAAEIRPQARSFFDPDIPTALRRALNYAGDHGFVASMPQLLNARANASYDNIIWNTWFTSYTEENVLPTPQGNHVVVAVHGGGILARPERLERSFHADLDLSNAEGLTGQGAVKISLKEAHDLLRGKLPDGTQIPIYTFTEFKAGITDLPMRYGVVADFKLVKQAVKGYETFEILQDDPTMIIRAGGAESLAAYLKKAKNRNNTKKMGTHHPFRRIDPSQPQCRIPFLAGNKGGRGSDGNTHDGGPGQWGYDADYGIGGNANIVGIARYVAVANHDVTTSLRNLDFEV